jgi:hypothetical protein
MENVEKGNLMSSLKKLIQPAKKYCKIWEDLRSRTKTKISGNKLKANKTGGGSSQEKQLSNIEEDILDIIKTVSVEGHNVEESTTAFDFGEVMDITESEHIPKNLPESIDNTHETIPDQLGLATTVPLKKKKIKKKKINKCCHCSNFV